ncbi:MAG: hypothetical protein WAN11_13630, partial [Syntrophobacteraceae bacterium]
RDSNLAFDLGSPPESSDPCRSYGLFPPAALKPDSCDGPGGSGSSIDRRDCLKAESAEPNEHQRLYERQ